MERTFTVESLTPTERGVADEAIKLFNSVQNTAPYAIICFLVPCAAGLIAMLVTVFAAVLHKQDPFFFDVTGSLVVDALVLPLIASLLIGALSYLVVFRPRKRRKERELRALLGSGDGGTMVAKLQRLALAKQVLENETPECFRPSVFVDEEPFASLTRYAEHTV